MTLKAIISTTASAHKETYYTEDNGIHVGHSGELTLVSGCCEKTGKPNDFRIYAPGMWKEVNAYQSDDE